MTARYRLAAAGLMLLAWIAAPARAAVDANTATQAELDRVTGIGPALAARIVEERRRSPFRSLDDLQARVRGVGQANMRRMRDDGLVVGSARTVGTTETIVGGVRETAPGRRVPAAVRR